MAAPPGALEPYAVWCGSQHRLVAYSHVWVPKERGTGRKYDIPDAFSVFGDGGAYVRALEAGREMLVAERPALFFPLLVDIDLRFAPGEVVRAFDDKFLRDVVRAYVRALAFMRAPKPPDDTAGERVEAYVMLRPHARRGDTENKDGVHILFPGVQLTGIAQAMVRERALADLGAALSRIPGQLKGVEDAVDACYCRGAPWQMYGSTKEGVPAYRVAWVATCAPDGEGLVELRAPGTGDIPPADAWAAWVRRTRVRALPWQPSPLSQAAQAEQDRDVHARRDEAGGLRPAPRGTLRLERQKHARRMHGRRARARAVASDVIASCRHLRDVAQCWVRNAQHVPGALGGVARVQCAVRQVRPRNVRALLGAA
jgi:hypothetical protein